MSKRIIVTGGAGFIGSAIIRYIIYHSLNYIINLDKLTYAGNLDNLLDIKHHPRYSFEKVDICDKLKLEKIFSKYQPDAVIHLAAESHVDHSINDASNFIQTNIIGTYVLLEVSRQYWNNLSIEKKQSFRFHHVSTDEVYGDLNNTDTLFTENTPYSPSSPYSASKASSDHLARAWFRTYGFPTIITNCSNNYGPYQFPEKLIPQTIINALQGKKIPIYGNGLQIRDWLFVEDHAIALYKVLTEGKIGETYNIGGNNQKTNIEVVTKICHLLEQLVPVKPLSIDKYEDLITYVDDRPGHDIRYAVDISKINQELGWIPKEDFDSGLFKTVMWYINNQNWWHKILDKENHRNSL